MNGPLHHEQRVIRVFVSSTFRDMQAERDELVKRVFPQLRKLCELRGVVWGEVDLRWGIPDEQKAEGQVLPICLAEIHHCRPYFIGLLGERYGWVPEAIPTTLMETEPWLVEHHGCSVTELEILQGVLNNPDMAHHAFFYFRDPHYSISQPSDHQHAFGEVPTPQEVEQLGAEEAHRRAAQRAEKLAALKVKIRSSRFPVRENYPDPQSLGQLVLQDFTELINRLYPEESVPNPLDRDAALHEAFAQSRARVYIGRQENFDRLNEHAQSDGPPLVVLGESGMGKSALLANWALQYRKEHPNDFVLFHFIGASADSTDWAAMLRRIMGELNRRFDMQQEIPDKPDALRLAFANSLHMAAAKGNIILILDALNQLEDREGAPDLVWFPLEIPSQVRLILSTLSGRALEDLTKRGWPTLTVLPLGPEERTQLITNYLAQYTKTLSAPQMKRVVSTSQTTNPLYLRTLLEELRVFGEYDRLEERMGDYLAAQTVPQLFEKILGRYEEDYERDRPGMVREALSCLWAARRGLTETELLELLGTNGKPLPQAHWSPLHLAMEQGLINPAGLLGFAHDYLRQAVQERYVPTVENQQTVHSHIAHYFERQELDSRKADELPWQLWRGEFWQRLKHCLTDMEMFWVLEKEARKYDLMRYWLSIEKKYDMVAAYTEMIEQYQRNSPDPSELRLRIARIAHFLKLNDKYEGAEWLFRRALAICEQSLGPEHSGTAVALGNLASLLDAKGDYEGAESLYGRALPIIEEALGHADFETAQILNNFAVMFSNKGDYKKAESFFRRAIAIFEKVIGLEARRTLRSLNNLAVLLVFKGDFKGAELYHRKVLATREKMYGPNHPETAQSLVGLAEAIRKMGDPEGAEPFYRRALAIYEQKLGPEHHETAIVLNNLAELLRGKGDNQGAEQGYHKALQIWEKLFGPDHPRTAIGLNNLAELLRGKGDYEGAEPLCRRALAIRENKLGPDHPHTAQSLGNLALLLDAKGDYEGAELLCRRALAIRKQVLGPKHPETRGNKDHLNYLLKRQKRSIWKFWK